jgi:HlyD family secretion protein
MLAEEEISRAREKLSWSKKLYKEKYISKSELQADELAEKKKVLDLDMTQNELNLLENFTHKRKLAQLETDVKQAKMALDRTIRKAKADIIQAKANLKAKEAESERQKTKLEKILRQIKNAKIYAPADGLIIYATSAKRGHKGRPVEPLQAGQLVREYQDLIYLPKSTAALAVITVHEFNLNTIRKGQPVIITVDAIPGLTIKGRVARIASLPNPQRAFLNPDLKVYNAEIYLSGFHKSLRTGMNCKAEIIIEQHKTATYIPVQAVLRIDGRATVYVVENQTLEPRQVEIGLDNSRMVHILDGLKPGELVSLTAPLHATAVKPSTDIIYLNEIPELEELKGNETFSSDESSTDRQTDLAIKQKKKKKKKKKKF